MKGPRADVLGLSIIFLLVGSVGTAGLIPLAFLGLNTVTVSNTNVNVTENLSVSYDTTLTSNWNESINVEVWGQVKTQTGVIILGPTLSTTTLGAFETKTISGPLGFLTPSQNGYTLELFTWSNDPGWLSPLSPKTTFNFNVGPEIDVIILPSPIGGSTIPSSGTYTISLGSSFTVSAVPVSPHIFEFWKYTNEAGAEFTTQGNPFKLNTAQDVTIQAFFKDTSIPFETLVVRTQGSGTTNPPPGTYSDIYRQGDDSVLTAIPDQGQELNHWEIVREVGGDYSDSKNSIIVSVDGFTTVTAVFSEVIINLYDVNISVFPLDAGTTNHGIGTMQFNEDENIRFVADANPGFTFREWSINGEMGWGGPIELIIDREYDITAYFDGGNFFILETFIVDNGRIDIQLLEGEQKSLLSGQTAYRENSKVKLIATAVTGWEFVHWTLGPGAEQIETSHEIILVMTQNWDATAQFKGIVEGDPKTDEPGIGGILFPVLLGIGVIGIVGSFYVPGGRRVSAGGRFG